MAVQTEALKSVNYFGGLDSAALEKIKPYLSERMVEKGEIFLLEGEWSEYLYFLIGGLVKV
jgi:CRP-like cAMP-binding protein